MYVIKVMSGRTCTLTLPDTWLLFPVRRRLSILQNITRCVHVVAWLDVV